MKIMFDLTSHNKRHTFGNFAKSKQKRKNRRKKYQLGFIFFEPKVNCVLGKFRFVK